LLCNIIAMLLLQITAFLPHGQWPLQTDYHQIMGMGLRIVAASTVAYFGGEFTNSFVLAKLKILTKGKLLWTRTIASTVTGVAIDSILFSTIGFLGYIAFATLIWVIVWQYLLKVAYEIIGTPLTYLVVWFLKRAEAKDHYDYQTKFNPFALRPPGE
jgi:queuosine precursor transporter